MKLSDYESIDWNKLSECGLLWKINKEILHPLGLAITRNAETGHSESIMVDNEPFSFPDEANQRNEAKYNEFIKSRMIEMSLDKLYLVEWDSSLDHAETITAILNEDQYDIFKRNNVSIQLRDFPKVFHDTLLKSEDFECRVIDALIAQEYTPYNQSIVEALIKKEKEILL